MTTCAGVLSRLTVALIEVHERTCEIEGPHGWERCTSTPSIFAAADALDLLDQARPTEVPVPVQTVARVLHDRECQEGACAWPAEEQQTEHATAWRDQAAALLVHADAEAAAPALVPPDLARRGDLLARCVCGHIRRGHSVDGRRCYHTPCTCQVDGGFRLAVT